MTKSKEYKLLDLIEEVEKVDNIIKTHQESDASYFIISQYEAKKTALGKQIILELASPEISSRKSFSIMKLFLNKFYNSPEIYGDKNSADSNYELIEKALC